MTGLPTKNKFALAGNPNIAPPPGPVALGSALDENFSNCAPLINTDNYPTNSALAIALANVAILNGAASSADQVRVGVGLVGGGSIGTSPTLAVNSELAGLSGLGTANLTGFVNRTGPGSYENVTLEAGSGITLTPGTNSLTISSGGGVNPVVVQSALGSIITGAEVGATFANPLTPGNFIIALFGIYTNSGSTSSQYTELLFQSEGHDNLRVAYRFVQAGDPQTQVCGSAPGSGAIAMLFEVSGISAPPFIDVHTLSQTDATTSNTVTTSNTSSTVLGLVLSYATSSVTVTPDSSWNVDQQGSTPYGEVAWGGHKLYSESGSPISETTTFSASTSNEVILIGLRINGSGVTIPPLNFNNQTGTTYTLNSYDARGLVVMNNASANTVTVPPNSSVPFQVGDAIAIEQGGAGKTTIAAGSGVTLNYLSTLTTSIVGQYGVAQLVKTGTDTWTLFGAIGG